MNRRAFLLLLLLVLLSRLPFLFAGYGSDADAWRVAATAYRLQEEGVYRVSRMPGYPLHEFLAAPFVLAGGAPLANATSLAAMLLLLAAWRRLTRTAARHPALLLVCLAFTPVLWKNSTTTMDYLWSLLFIILSFERLLSADPGKHTAGFVTPGALLGFAVGFRPANAVMILPLLVLLRTRRTPLRATSAFFAGACVAALLSFLPVLAAYGPLVWVTQTVALNAAPPSPPGEHLLLFAYRSTYLLGPLAVIAALFILCRGGRVPAGPPKAGDPPPPVLAAGAAAPFLLYLLFPYEREYLIPSIPFVFLLLDRVATRAHLLIFTAAVVSLAVVTPDVVRHSGFRGTPGLNLHDGLLQQHVRTQQRIRALREELGTLPLDGPAVVMAGNGPEIWLENDLFRRDTAAFWTRFPEVVVHQRRDPRVHILYGLPAAELTLVREAGYRVYFHDPAREYLERVLGYRMDEQGVTAAR